MSVNIYPIIFVLLVSLSCSQIESEEQYFSSEILSSGTLPMEVDTLVSLYKWAMSTGDPLWADSSSKRVVVRPSEAMALELPSSLQYLIPKNLVANGSKLFVMDYSNFVLCFDLHGNLQWITGGRGEAPGEYSGVVNLTLGERFLLARDSSTQRVDRYTLEGELLASEIVQYIQFVLPFNLDTYLVFSSIFDDGVVGVLEMSNLSQGNYWGDDTDQYSIPYFPFYRYGVVSDTGRFAVASYKHTYLVLGSVDGEFSIVARELPYNIPSEISYTSRNGTEGMQVVPLVGSVFIGPHGMINVQMVIPDPDGANPISISGSETDYTLIDRYSWDGEYLDSYIIPRGRIWSIAYVNETLFAVGDDETVYKFPVLFTE